MLYHVFTETRPKPLLIIIVSLSIFLTVSGTAIILLLLIVFMTYAKDRFFALIPFLLPLPILSSFLVMSLSS